MKKKILLFGPIGDFGGRELETGFIASVLASKYDVDICTTDSVTKKSQVFDFDKNQKVYSVKGLLYDKYFSIKILSFLSFLKNRFEKRISTYANNAIAKKYFNYQKKRSIVLEELIQKYDAIFICAQLMSSLVSETIYIAKKNNKKIIFRTTGAIKTIDFDYINEVDLFIHHSLNNANKLKNFSKHNFIIIDQCAFNENKLLPIPIVKNEVKTFLTIARLEKEKNIDVLLQAFLKSFDENYKLIIIGIGSELNNLKEIAKNSTNVLFTGFVENSKISDFFQKSECIIISHFDLETGPLTGIEAMASGRLIISAKTGAMQERLSELGYFFDNNITSITEQMNKVKDLNSDKISVLSKEIRETYLSKYSRSSISLKYLNAINKVLEL